MFLSIAAAGSCLRGLDVGRRDVGFGDLAPDVGPYSRRRLGAAAARDDDPHRFLLQDALTWVRRKLNLPSVTLPRSLDRALRWGRFVVLAVVMYFSYTTAKLWFADYDPYVTLFGLHWLFGAESSGFWIALLILGVVAAASVVIDRFWCRYLCPLGAVFAVVGRFSLLRLRRSAVTCTDCTLCDKPCPVGIEPSKAKPFVSSDCIGCMDCVATCPVPGALTLRAPVPVSYTHLTLPTNREV